MLSSPTAEITLAVISNLVRHLDDRGVRYVHWKSNNNIVRALRGDDDLDLLVHPDDAHAFEEILDALGFVRALVNKDAWQPGMYHYYRPDLDSGRIVHLHLHYSLTVGYDFHKNFTLPITDWYLSGRSNSVGISLPAPEREYAVFVIRLLIKHALSVAVLEFPRPQLMRVLGRLAPGHLSSSERGELEYLASAVDRHALQRAIELSGLGISWADFSLFEHAVSNDVPAATFFATARALKRRLAATRQSGELSSFALAAGRLNSQRVRRGLSRLGFAASPRKECATGGRIFAFVGGDGAGKSTNVDSLYRSLKSAFYTETIHVGRPEKSLGGAIVGLIGRGMRVLGLRRTGRALGHIALAHNRRAAFRKAERVRSAGGMAVLDRIPDNQLKHMDAPRIVDPDGRLERLLAAWERSIYREITGVDVMIVLRLDPEIACQRRPEDDRETLLERSGEVWRGDWTAPYMFAVDTGASDVNAVRRAVMERVWASVRTPFIRAEIVGLSGAGKSTVVASVAQGLSNVRTTLPYRDFPLALVRSTLAQAWSRILSRRRATPGVDRNLAQLRWFVLAAPALLRRDHAHNYVLDQGPIFQLAIGIKELEIVESDRLFAAAVGAIARWMATGAIYLQVEPSTVAARVRERPGQLTRSSQLIDLELETFYADYQRAIDRVRACILNTVAVSGEASPVEVADSVWDRLTVSSRG